MKKSFALIVFPLLLAFLTSSPCEAQKKSGARFGVKAGLNLSNLYTRDADNNKLLTGFNVGLFAKLPIVSIVSIQPELYFTTKGSEVTYGSLFMNGTAQFRLNYVELPLLLVVNITRNLNIHAGPYVSYLISGIVKNESNVNLFDFENNIDTGDFNRLDAGIAVGAGIDVGGISLGTRYNYGFTKVGREQSIFGVTYTVPDANNGVFSLYLSLSLN